MRLSRIILIFLIAVLVSQCVYYYPNLPEIMASHFNGAGAANDWMSKQNFFLLEAGILLLIVLEFTLMPLLIRKVPKALINMPNKDYWFADERRAATIETMKHFFDWFSIGLLALFIGINQLVFRANLNNENLSSMSWLILGAFLIFIAVWLIKFYKRFKIKEL